MIWSKRNHEENENDEHTISPLVDLIETTELLDLEEDSEATTDFTP